MTYPDVASLSDTLGGRPGISLGMPRSNKTRLVVPETVVSMRNDQLGIVGKTVNEAKSGLTRCSAPRFSIVPVVLMMYWLATAPDGIWKGGGDDIVVEDLKANVTCCERRMIFPHR